MKIKSIVMRMILGFFYPISLLLKAHPNRITFFSLEHNNLSKDFKLVYEYLEEKRDYELKTVLFKFENSFWGNIKYGFACIKQLFLLETSRLVIIDYNNFVISKFQHHKDVNVLQLWHATGAIKKFGNDVKRDYRIGHYDYVIVNSDFYRPIFAQAFNLPVSRVRATGIPNNDKLFNSNFIEQTRKRLLEKYPVLIGKKVVTYAPTFRGRISTKFKEVAIDLRMVYQTLGEDYVIVYKAHPLIVHSKYEDNPNILFIKDELISSIFCVTDILVTDYSAIMIDWMIFNKPIIAYVPDFLSYGTKPGFTIDFLEEFPGIITTNEEELGEAIKATQKDTYQKKRQIFSEKVYKFRDGGSTGRVIELIDAIMKQK